MIIISSFGVSTFYLGEKDGLVIDFFANIV